MVVWAIALSLLLFLFGCNGGGGGGGGAGVNYGHTLNITITDSTGAAVAGLTVDHIDVTTESGNVGDIIVAGTQVTFSVDGIEIDPNYITMTVDLAGYFPLIRRYLATVTGVTDESGENFTSVLATYAEIPPGGGAGDTPPTAHDPNTGTAEDLTPDQPVDAGDGFEATGTLPAGTVLTTTDGDTVTDQVYMQLTYHQGTTNQESYYPGGTYGGDAPDAFGTVSFLSSSTDNTLSTSTNTNVALDLTFGTTAAATGGYIESDPVAETQSTNACIVDISTNQAVTITGCSYDTDTGMYTCANGYYTFTSGTSVGTYRVDGGSCP
jgi:hypothetical protein